MPMNERVFSVGHVTVDQLLTDFLKLVGLLVRRITAPFRQIHRLPGLAYIARDDPRDGSDVTVPGPRSFIGVAVLAGALEDGFRLGRRRQGRVDGLRWIHPGATSIHRDELTGHQENQDGKSDSPSQRYTQNFPHGLSGPRYVQCNDFT